MQLSRNIKRSQANNNAYAERMSACAALDFEKEGQTPKLSGSGE